MPCGINKTAASRASNLGKMVGKIALSFSQSSSDKVACICGKDISDAIDSSAKAFILTVGFCPQSKKKISAIKKRIFCLYINSPLKRRGFILIILGKYMAI